MDNEAFQSSMWPRNKANQQVIKDKKQKRHSCVLIHSQPSLNQQFQIRFKNLRFSNQLRSSKNLHVQGRIDQVCNP